MLRKLAALVELLGILLTSFALNMIPFAGPSNLLIASNASLLVEADPFAIGFLVALGAACAKLIHYFVTFFIGGFMGQKRREHLNTVASKLKGWAPLALFVVAATPLPDEPVIIPLGLLKYNPVKFFAAFFTGKLAITVLGAYLGVLSQSMFVPFVGNEVLMAASITSTVVLTIVLLKVDVGKIIERIMKRKVG